MVKIEYLKASELTFDSQNPRLAEYDVSENETATLKFLWAEMDVKELVMSILANGFFDSEPLYVIPDGKKWIVIEGNRRLAAVKAILNPESIPGMSAFAGKITDSIVKELTDHIPVVKQSTREDAWRYIGFKHVKGAAKWDSYAKAKYISLVHNEYKVSLSDIADQIGDSKRTTLRLYRGLSILEQAEKITEFRRSDVYYGRIYFSHLYTAIGYDGFYKYLGIKDIDAEEFIVPEDHSKQLLQVMRWLYGSQDQKIEPVVKKQNPDLRQLGQVLQKAESVQVLISTGNLERAYDNSQDSNEVLRKSMIDAKLNIEDAMAKISVFDGGRDALELSSQLAQATYRLFDGLKNVYEKSKQLDEAHRFSID